MYEKGIVGYCGIATETLCALGDRAREMVEPRLCHKMHVNARRDGYAIVFPSLRRTERAHADGTTRITWRAQTARIQDA